MRNWKPVLEASGVDPCYLTGKHGPCPMCGGKDRFRYTNHKKEGGYFCNQCGSGDGFGLLKAYHNISFEEAHKMALENGLEGFTSYKHKPELEEQRKLDNNKKLFEEKIQKLQPAKGTPVELYLHSRKLMIPKPFQYRGHMIECFYLPDDEYYHDGQVHILDAMAWKMVDSNGEFNTLHRTYINRDGTKANLPDNKRVTAKISIQQNHKEYFKTIPLIKGSNNIVILAEGVETALSAHAMMLQYHNENCHAVSTIHAGYMSKYWQAKNLDTQYLIFADNDESRTGQLSAISCAYNLMKQHHVNIVLPPNKGEDWNDIWMNGTESDWRSMPFKYWF